MVHGLCFLFVYRIHLHPPHQQLYKLVSYRYSIITNNMTRVTQCWSSVYIIHYLFFFLLLVLHAPLIALSQLIGAHDTDVSVGVRLLSEKPCYRRKKTHWSQVELEPRSLQIKLIKLTYYQLNQDLQILPTFTSISYSLQIIT